ncbi:hypothetical protein ACLI4R_08435 [Natrialbaceae archaeon A-chndr2]
MNVNTEHKKRSTDVGGRVAPKSISEEECFALLSDYRRRLAVEYLSRTGEATTVQELAAKIAAQETGVPEERITDQQQNRVSTSLHHHHVPRMAEMGVIEYNEEKDRVAIGPSAVTLEPYLSTDRRKQTNKILYSGLAILNLVAIAIVAVGWWVLSTASSGEIVLFTLVVFLVNTLAYASVAGVERETDFIKSSL